ncbi:GNAT family N-acetyltransferase [Shewanella atlantica]|uniref:GNAT family N-acetyltransferase n=1 Tax=Shewanella atlantica TaxID=271099 RepID=A0A431WHH8_9GAMM|nr:GNAT family N-acetyltransferase [Shewanella atlantica]RTR34787.1 GNAT family N-acetyltransferase [Shewanella atlantica]
MKIVKNPTEAHLRDLYKWLKDEEIESGEGFFCNWNIIANSVSEDKLYIVELDSRAVALLVKWQFSSCFEIDILTVEPRYRGKGIGRHLATSLIDEAKKVNAEKISIQCMPTSSEAFWKSLGFIEDPDKLCERIRGVPMQDLHLEMRLCANEL